MRISVWSSGVGPAELRAVNVAQGVDGIGFERIRAVRGGLKVRILPVGLGAYVETVRIGLDIRDRDVGGERLDVEAVIDIAGLEAGVEAVEIDFEIVRSEERRVGKECVSPCRSRWWPCHEKKTNKQDKEII